ncbi:MULTISPECIES: AIPR family protein [Actinomycetes]|uniref:AIPR family protein n=2 Tax=Actinomycetes TaxID=1760 RepID=A0ABP6M429_9MICC
MDLSEFQTELLNSGRTTADVELTTFDEAMGHALCELLEELEIVHDLQEFHARAKGNHNRQLALAAVGEDPVDGTATLVVTHCVDDVNTSFGKADIDRAMTGAAQFVTLSVSGALQQHLEESSTAFELAEYLRDRAGETHRYRVELVSNAVATHAVKNMSFESVSVEGATMSFRVWDAGRLHSASSSASGREEIEIHLGEEGEGVPCVHGGTTPDGIKTYLLTMSGQQLAAIYDQYGSRVLESNVRGFLSVRGNVNKGIQHTLAQEPSMFLAYNNGLTTTATDVQLVQHSGALRVTSLTDWQIVNGGQTTASMWYYSNQHRRRNPHKLQHLEEATVQVKLVVVDEDRAADIVPDIARYANSQNKVNVSDFSSNSGFHREMDRLSGRVMAPAQDTQFDTRWFYERTRGAFENARAREIGARRRQFDAQNPKTQKFDKLELARVENIWRLEPHIVSKGAQSSFVHFTEWVNEAWEADASQFNEAYFRDLVSRLILARQTRQLVQEAEWYSTGYLANIVAYGLSKFLYDLTDMFDGHQIDLPAIWRSQACEQGLLENIDVACEAAREHLVSEDRPQQNVTQWAKQALCWTTFRDTPLEYYETAHDVIISDEERQQEFAGAAEEQKATAQLLNYFELVSLDPKTWPALRDFASEYRMKSEKESSILNRMISQGFVSESQGNVLAKLLERAEASGFKR